MYGYLFQLILAFLTFGNKGVKVLAGSFLRSNLLQYAQNFQWVQKPIFPYGKHIVIAILDRFLKFEESFEMRQALCKFPIVFSVVKLKLEHNFSQFIHRFKLGLLNVGLGCTSRVFPVHKEIENWDS